MPSDDIDYEELTKTLTDNFNVLADEVQLLSDRKLILEHKLRFAHEQCKLPLSFYLPQPQSCMMKHIALDLETAIAAMTDKHHVT